MFAQTLGRRLAQQTAATCRQSIRTRSTAFGAVSQQTKHWKHTRTYASDGEGAVASSVSGTSSQGSPSGQPFIYANDGEGNVAFASGTNRKKSNDDTFRIARRHRLSATKEIWLTEGIHAVIGKSRGGWAFRKGVYFALFGLAFSGIGAYATWQTLRSQGLGFFSDEESLRRFSPDETNSEARRVEDIINNHPLVAELRSRPDFVESRPHMKMPGQYRARSLTGSALSGPGKVPAPAYAWIENGGKSLVSIVYVGEDLCGHPGIVHGGFLATMLDEGLARCCFGALPHNIAVTANLNVDYRKPTPAGSFLVLRAETTKVDGRKAWVKGRIEELVAPEEKPTVYAEATALFISPKYAAVSGLPGDGP